jgi:hypothetical protein
MVKKCPPGKYYCFTDKKCKKIPRGYYIGARGYLARGDNRSDSGNGNGNGSSNGNGNGGNGAGNGNGGSGGNGGGNGGGGMGESIVYEASNPRIPRKKGQPAKSKKHSDLYTDEDPKGTIHGLGFKDVAKAKASVSKIRNSSRSHAHKIQAAVAMEQRAREMGKTSEAAVYRKYINAMKKKTKKMNEGMYNHSDVGLITNAVVELEDGLKTLKTITYDSVDQLMQGIAKRNDISPTLLHNQFKAKHFTIPDNWAIRYRMNKMKGIEEATMTPAQKRKDTMLKKKYDKSDMKKSMQKQYGKEEGKKVYFATIRKQAMGEESQDEMLARVRAAQKKVQDKVDSKNKMKKANQPFIEPKKGEVIDDDYKYNVSEEGLRDWFGKSSGTTKSGRKVRGWVQVGGKYDGKPCARQPGQKSTPKCVSSSKRRSMSKSERDSAARRKRAADPNQPQKSGAAKPTNVSTDPKRKMKENYFNRNKLVDEAKIDDKLRKDAEPIKGGGLYKTGMSKKVMGDRKVKVRRDMDAFGSTSISGKEQLQRQKDHQSKRGVKTKGVINDEFVNEAKDKKGKGSGKKDACYHKVKARYDVWPSAYASGALVKCRKVGAKNWGNKTKKEGFSPMQVAALEAAGMIELNEAGKKCWKGYKKAGTQKLFGKTYNRCVKAGDELNHDGESLQEMNPSFDIKQTRTQKLQGMTKSPNPNEAAVAKKKLEQQQSKEPKLPTLNNSYAPVTEGVAFLKREKKKSSSKYLTQRDAGKLAKRVMAKKDQETVNFLEPAYESKTRLVKNGHTYKVVLTWRGKTYMVQMFVPSVSRPTRQQVEKEVQKIYPDAKLMSFLPRDLEPGEPTVMMGEMADLPKFSQDSVSKAKGADSSFIKPNSQKRRVTMRDKMKEIKDDPKGNKAKEDAMKDMGEATINELSLDTLSQAARVAMTKRDAARGTSEFVKRQKQTEKFTNAAVKKRRELDATKDKLGKTFKGPDADRTPTMEEVVTEDDMKGMSVKSGHKRPTKSGAGMTAKGVAAYRRRNPGSKLQTAVTGKVKKGSKDAKRRKSYCARSAGQMKKFPKAAKDPNSRLRQARRRWKC